MRLEVNSLILNPLIWICLTVNRQTDPDQGIGDQEMSSNLRCRTIGQVMREVK